MKKVVFVCMNDETICHVFEKEQDAKLWCLEQYFTHYGAYWDQEVEEFGGNEDEFKEYLMSGETWPYGYQDIEFN